jgi:hypothetical protein
MIDASGNGTRQLINPDLAHRTPFSARKPPQKVLAASTGPVYAVLDAQEDVFAELCDLRCNRAPECVTSRLEALMPDGPNASRFSRGEKYHLDFADRIARYGTTRGVLGGEK